MTLAQSVAEHLEEIPADAAILIAGPPMTGKYHLLLQLLLQRADSVITVTTKNGYERIREDFHQLGHGRIDESRLGIIDCVSYHQPIDADEIEGPVRLAETPENLTRIGVRFSELFDAFIDDPEKGTIGVGVHSVSQLLMHSEVKQVYQFLQVLIGQVRNEREFMVAVVDAATTGDETIQLLQQHFDGLMETRENEAGSREFRVRGLGPATTSWTEF